MARQGTRKRAKAEGQMPLGGGAVEKPAPACAACGDTGEVASTCSNPQCGDSTWDHECGAGGREPCSCKAGYARRPARTDLAPEGEPVSNKTTIAERSPVVDQEQEREWTGARLMAHDTELDAGQPPTPRPPAMEFQAVGGAPAFEVLEVPPEVLGYQDSDNPAVNEGWHIRDTTDADWALYRLAQLEKQKEENAAAVEAAVARLRARGTELNSKLDRGVAFFSYHLTRYATEKREDLLGNGRRKSRDLPHGRIGFRKVGGDLVVENEEALLAWCQRQPVEMEVLRVKEEPAWGNVKKHWATSGEIPPGCTVSTEGERVELKPELPELAAGKKGELP